MNNDQKFSIGDIIETAWTKQKERLVYYAWVFAVYQAIAYFLNFFAEKAKGQTLTYVSFQFATAIILIIMQIGIVRFFVRVVDGDRPELGDIFEGGDYFWRYLGAIILVGSVAFVAAIPIAGLIVWAFLWKAGALILLPILIAVALLIFYIYLATHFIFFPYLVVDQNAGPITAIKESWKMARGLEWQLVLFMAVLAAINIVGALLVGIGLLVSIPLTQLSVAMLYRKLQTEKQKDELPSLEVNESPVTV